jgi:hypothetical protein
MLELFKRMWLRWQGAASGIITAQNAVLMSVAYFVGVGPVALFQRAVGHTNLDRAAAKPGADTYWQPRSGKKQTMEEASRQF